MTEERRKLCDALRMLWNAPAVCLKAADEIEQLEADKMNAEYQRDRALTELKDQDMRLAGLAERVEQLEARVTALSRM
jgi:uncharacterized protein YlxW (UPF0749 family)